MSDLSDRQLRKIKNRFHYRKQQAEQHLDVMAEQLKTLGMDGAKFAAEMKERLSGLADVVDDRIDELLEL